MVTFKDSIKTFKLDRDLLETMTNFDINVSHSNLQDQKLIYKFGKEMKFDIKQKGRKSNRDRYISTIKLLKSPRIIASGYSNIIILTFDPNELCNRLSLLIQRKQAANNSEIFNQENIGMVDKLSE